MSEQIVDVMIETAAVSDRGLNEKRPHNEDSYLLDGERRIFVVADGVGGAQAGEVASQTAVEVLAEAFRHHNAGDDVEDLMELAIQRANASIYQMAHEQRHLAMMATTVVALHLDGRHATVGHVGDSRLYRLMPDGTLQRETQDHSVVEEEVRAGRMTAEQAANHPSRNVISRALGAEQSVEVDLKTLEVEDGTVFLLCSDGITRHIPDAELRALLSEAETLEAACAELKRRCYERGAEDNLTAVVVRVGAPVQQPSAQPAVASAATDDDEERTIHNINSTRAATGAAAADTTTLVRPFANAGANVKGNSRVVVPAAQADGTHDLRASKTTGAVRERSAVGRALRWLGGLLLVLAAAAAAFYGGMRYQKAHAVFATEQNTPAVNQPTPETPEAHFAGERREVDAAPGQMVQKYAALVAQQDPQANDPEFLYLYGRALLLSGNQAEAVKRLEQAAQLLNQRAAAARDPLRVETRIATAAAALKSKDPAAQQRAVQELDEVIEQQNTFAAPSATATPQ